ncbi:MULTISPECIES: helix-turn-helix domain-containing protein [Thermobifida]|uniref:helix-turn-helix domain-containing protein n=1 Tax=Thermobifida TaxID=83677 RepID=UPI000CEF57A1|nr:MULTISPECIES: helix-turn-helix domain-containing protein [Thermobifida]MBO2530943.1 diguanylate phosphodiesterase [Thermobifida sp.]PPS92113.1 diguanylate phosphodiesterase [Thermobifida fusca]
MERELNNTPVPPEDDPWAVDAQSAFLELLLRDAPAVEYERPLLEARARGDTPETLARLERAKLLALRVRSVLRDLQRRESELTALFETANDLTGMRSLDQMLRAIVDRARHLLNTDVAYLTLSDPERGDTYMRVTSGSVSARFQQLRLGHGEGLGGLVAQTALPYVTANYFADTRFQHTEHIDAGVREEGLVAILGVPLQLNGRVIGVLFAANRRERPFSHAEVALLSSLATHAAIAIDNANLIDDTRRALAELNTVNQRLQEHTESVERAAAAHDRLTDLVLRGGGIEEVAAAVGDVLGGQVCIHDLNTAATPPPCCEDPAVAEAVQTALHSGRTARAGDAWVAAAAAGSELLGMLVLRGIEPDITGQRILERAAVVTALLLLIRRSATEAEHRVRGDLLDELLDTPDRDPESLRQRAARLGANLTVPHVVAVAESPGADVGRLRLAAMHIAETTGGLAGIRGGRVVLVLPGTDPTTVGRRIGADLGVAVNGPVTVGVAGPVEALPGFRSSFTEALRCLQTLQALGRTGEVAAPTDLGFLGLLLGDDRDVDGFVTATLGPLLDYDARRKTALVDTLRAYFAAGGNLSRAKDALHVHVNTVSQRLERISQLIGDDWQEPSRALEIQLALRLHGLLDRGVDLGGNRGRG